MSATDSWVAQSQSPNLKFENSPAESFLSAPGDMYPSLFGATSPATTMNPLDIMTPKSVAEEPLTADLALLSGLAAPASAAPSSPAAAGEKKTKKRKSWGQVLPEPKTNLPPRKRAKTEDEKEQRRVERVLRNRRAAQSSRERKRLEVEALEIRNKDLESLLRQVQQTNLALIEELRKVQRGSGVVSRTSPSFGGPSPVTFSQELFSSQDGHSAIELGSRSIEELLMSTSSHTTVNPASLSPSLHPVDEDGEMSDDDDEEEDEDADEKPASSSEQKAAPVIPAAADVETTPQARTSPDTTQHPAAMLCQDLLCRSAEVPRSAVTSSTPSQLPQMLALLLPLQLLLTSTSAMMVSVFQRPLMQIAMSLRAGSSLPPAPSILTTIIWLVTTTRSRAPTSSTSTTTSTTATSSSSSCPLPLLLSQTTSTPPQQTRPSSTTLRLKSLRKILSSSPTLARPLLDATMAALRLVSSEELPVDRVSKSGESVVAAVDAVADSNQEQQQQQLFDVSSWPAGTSLPSKEVLLTMMWAITVEERRMQMRRGNKHISSSLSPKKTSVVLKRPGRQGVPRRIVPSAASRQC